MGKIQMCRICLAEDVRMYVVVNKTLHDLYEKLTDNPFVTEDSRPILACFICCAQLKKCYRFMKKCLEAEEMFAKMMNEEYEQKPLINKGHLEVFHGFIKTPISIINVNQTETILSKEELPAVCARFDDVIEPKEEQESDDDLKTDTFDNFVTVECTPIYDSESDSEYDLTLMKVKSEKEQAKSKRKRKTEKNIRAPIAKKRNMETKRSKLTNTSTAEPKKTDPKKIQNVINRSSKTFLTRKLKVQNSNKNTVKKIGLTKTSKESKPYKCDILPETFNQNSDITIKNHTAVRPFKCHICQSRFKHKGNLTNHILTHTGEKPYKCDFCPSSFTGKSTLGSHMKTHIGEKPFICDICSRSFNHKSSIILHIRTHIAEKRFKCDICHLNFTGSSHLQKHRLVVHSGEKRFKCDVCGSSFDRRYQLKSHNLKHTGEKPFICDMCPSSFRVKSLLTRHIRIHTGEKPFKCEICQRSFNQRNTLTDHMRIHTREKPFKCHICFRGFSHKNLQPHIRSHTGEKPFKCEICQSSFSLKSSLKSHIRLHTGEKPYKCDLCDRSFKQRISLNKHVKNGLCKKDKSGDNELSAREST